MTLQFKVIDQVVVKSIYAQTVSDSEKYLRIALDIPTEWKGGIITAYFKNSTKTNGEPIVLVNGECEVPSAYIKAPNFYISFACDKEEMFIPTTEVEVIVKQSGIPQELLPIPGEVVNQYSELQQMYQEIIQISEEGIEGKSAYQVALDNGFIGTELEWLGSLKGEQGIQGIQGIQGTQGIPGDKGDKGIQGEPGAAGYTPIKGIDYFDGEKGDAGQSAYQIWLGLGNVGSEQDFIDSLKGAQGILDTTSSGTVTKKLVRNTAIKISTALTSLTLTYPTTYYWYDVFTIIFKTSALTLPSGVVWHDGTAPTIDSGKWYELSIRDNRAVLSGGVA